MHKDENRKETMGQRTIRYNNATNPKRKKIHANRRKTYKVPPWNPMTEARTVQNLASEVGSRSEDETNAGAPKLEPSPPESRLSLTESPLPSP